ncbi:hypothetical protein BUALT_Bualt08G0117900 [Buddleja alternifolia]|uniref:Chaperone DnaJ C-terminal domain-containing protein n=1 Tax=Buddleja alternifolia TaxID=168488 RepID=A0AAV6XGL2_9LAMI|nr:hypothetical protein BUALT_Bualt08G0117900 [Buddleja alternifolia]
MEDQLSRSHSHDMLHVLGFGSIYRGCKSFVSKCYPNMHSSLPKKKTENKTKAKSIHEDIIKSHKERNQSPINRHSQEERMQEMQDLRNSFTRRSCDGYMKQSPQGSPINTSPSRNRRQGPSPLSRSTSRLSQAGMTPTRAALLRTMSHKNGFDAGSGALPRSLSRTTSRIVYSNSHGIIKPPAMEQQLDCTLEELCFGCVKKVKITRETITDDGEILEVDEVLTIKVKPGWRKGTKIMFEGKRNEITPGADPADVIFTVAEEDHPLFIREGDDLELEMEIPLVEALTGCNISVPLLRGQEMSLTIDDDIIYPGYRKIIEGQGMPKQNEPGIRADLIITFLVKFPEELTEEQRHNAVHILENILENQG